MNANTINGDYLEDLYPEIIKNIYTQESIDNMVSMMKSLNLNKNSEEYLNFCISIKEAINTYEKNKGKKYIFSDSFLEEILDETDLIQQMKKFNTENNNVVSIQDGSEYHNDTTIIQNGFSNRFKRIFEKFKI